MKEPDRYTYQLLYLVINHVLISWVVENLVTAGRIGLGCSLDFLYHYKRNIALSEWDSCEFERSERMSCSMNIMEYIKVDTAGSGQTFSFNQIQLVFLELFLLMKKNFVICLRNNLSIIRWINIA